MGFVEYVTQADLRFLQERELGLDLYYSGAPGLAVAALAVASATVFLLAIFQLVPSRRHVAALLLGGGAVAFLAGLGGTWLEFHAISEGEATVAREAAGPDPVTLGQEAAVVALPLLLGTATCIADALGCAYLAVFWGTSHLAQRRAPRTAGG